MENKIYELILEHHGIFSEVVKNLIDQSSGGEGCFVLSDNNTMVKFEKATDVLIDFFNFSLNNKKMLNKLYLHLGKISEGYIEEKTEINSRIINLLEEFVTASGFPGIDYSFDYNWEDIFKIYHLEFIEDYSNILEKMISYIKIVSMFSEIGIIFLVNIRAYLSKEDLEELYEIARYSKVTLFLIEPYESRDRGEEVRYIIDNDQCLIDAN